MYQIGTSACTKTAHYFEGLWVWLYFCPFVACLLIVLENNSFIKFLWRHVTPKGQTRDPNALSPISRKRLEIETPFQSTTNRKWPTGYRTVTWPMSSRDRCRHVTRKVKLVTPIRLECTTLCSEKKHPLTFSFISSWVMRRFKQKLQWIYLRNGRFWQCRN